MLALCGTMVEELASSLLESFTNGVKARDVLWLATASSSWSTTGKPLRPNSQAE